MPQVTLVLCPAFWCSCCASCSSTCDELNLLTTSLCDGLNLLTTSLCELNLLSTQLASLVEANVGYVIN